MPSTKQQIVNAIKTHIQNNGGEYGGWYVGICSSIRHEQTGQDKAKHLFISRQAFSSYVATEVQDYFINRLGTNGGIGTDNGNGDIIYAYRKSVEAIEQAPSAKGMRNEIEKK